jgi:hypothetical protein
VRRVFFSSVVLSQVLLVGFLTATGESIEGDAASTSVVPGTAGWVLPAPPAHPLDPGNPRPRTRLAVAGDVGTGAAAEWATAELMAAAEEAGEFDSLVLLGDNVYPHGDPDRLTATVFDPFAAVLDDGTVLSGVLGNHDVEQNHAPGQVAALGMPGRWYERYFGDVHLIVLDSTQPASEAQQAFLGDALAASTANWKIVALHHPPFSAGSHGSDLPSREAFADIFAAHDVDLVLAGHDHDYQRSLPIGGVTYIVSGGAAKLRPTGRLPFTAASASELHFVTVDVWEDYLVATAFTHEGVLDRVVLAAG